MNKVLNIEIKSPEDALADFGKALEALETGQEAYPQFSVGFEDVPQFAKVFTPKRWELITCLKQVGTVSIYELAKRLGRHYRNVHQDISLLMKWMVVEKDEDGKVLIPWDEIDVKLLLPVAA